MQLKKRFKELMGEGNFNCILKGDTQKREYINAYLNKPYIK